MGSKRMATSHRSKPLRRLEQPNFGRSCGKCRKCRNARQGAFSAFPAISADDRAGIFVYDERREYGWADQMHKKSAVLAAAVAWALSSETWLRRRSPRQSWRSVLRVNGRFRP